MNAVWIAAFGDSVDLEIRDIPAPPKPTGTEILVNVRAAGLNRADLLQSRGLYPPPAPYSPNIPGLEFAGEVAFVGDRVSRFKPGDGVFGITAGEAQAEYLLLDESLAAPIPSNLSFAEAATVPEAFVTAHDAIFSLGALAYGEALLIHAVGSGVGLAALQLAKAAGSLVIGTSRTQDKLDRCISFGLDAGILTGREVDFSSAVKEATDGNGADCILDLVGAAYFNENLLSLAVKGRLMLVGLTSGRDAAFNMGLALQKRASITGTVLRPRPLSEKADAIRKFASDVLPLLASGSVVPNLDRTFKAADVVEAYKYLGSNESFGKVVLEF